MKRIIIALTGASGLIYGIRLLQELIKTDNEVHLVISKWAKKIMMKETDYKIDDIKNLANYYYEHDDLDTVIASGSYKIDYMVIVPASMKTLSGIACGSSSNLILRAADVTLKERRKMIVVPRESPLNVIHLENMLKLAKLGVVILIPTPAFYMNPKTVNDIINFTIGKVLDHLEIENDLKGNINQKSKI